MAADPELQEIYGEISRRGMFKADKEMQEIGHELRKRGIIKDPTQGGLFPATTQPASDPKAPKPWQGVPTPVPKNLKKPDPNRKPLSFYEPEAGKRVSLLDQEIAGLGKKYPFTQRPGYRPVPGGAFEKEKADLHTRRDYQLVEWIGEAPRVLEDIQNKLAEARKAGDVEGMREARAALAKFRKMESRHSRIKGKYTVNKPSGWFDPNATSELSPIHTGMRYPEEVQPQTRFGQAVATVKSFVPFAIASGLDEPGGMDQARAVLQHKGVVPPLPRLTGRTPQERQQQIADKNLLINAVALFGGPSNFDEAGKPTLKGIAAYRENAEISRFSASERDAMWNAVMNPTAWQKTLRPVLFKHIDAELAAYALAGGNLQTAVELGSEALGPFLGKFIGKPIAKYVGKRLSGKVLSNAITQAIRRGSSQMFPKLTDEAVARMIRETVAQTAAGTAEGTVGGATAAGVMTYVATGGDLQKTQRAALEGGVKAGLIGGGIGLGTSVAGRGVQAGIAKVEQKKAPKPEPHKGARFTYQGNEIRVREQSAEALSNVVRDLETKPSRTPEEEHALKVATVHLEKVNNYHKSRSVTLPDEKAQKEHKARWQDPHNPYNRQHKVLENAAKNTQDETVKAILEEATGDLRRDFNFNERRRLQTKGAIPLIEDGVPNMAEVPHVSAWRKLTEEQRNKLPADVRKVLLLQDISNSRQILEPGRASENVIRKGEGGALEKRADELFEQAQDEYQTQLLGRKPIPVQETPAPVVGEEQLGPPAPVDETPEAIIEPESPLPQLDLEAPQNRRQDPDRLNESAGGFKSDYMRRRDEEYDAFRSEYKRLNEGNEPSTELMTGMRGMVDRLTEPSRDQATGLLSNDSLMRTVDHAAEHSKKTGEEAHYFEADIVNLGGLNKEISPGEADKVMVKFSEFIRTELEQEGVHLSFYKKGGDELGGVVVGMKGADIEAALKRAKVAADDWVANTSIGGKKLKDIPHTKVDKGPGTGFVYDLGKIEPGIKAKDQVDRIAGKAEAAKVKAKQQPKEGEVVGKEPTNRKPLWEMGLDELDQAYESARQDDANLLIKLFGEEGAKRYKSLDRKANSTSAPFKEIDKAYKEQQAMEATLTDAERQMLYGVENELPSPDEVRDYQRAIGQIYGDTAEELGDSLKYALTKVGQETDPAKMSSEEQVAYAQLRYGAQLAREKGFNTAEVTKAAAKGAVERHADPEDAAFMLRRFFVNMPKEPKQQGAVGAAPKALPAKTDKSAPVKKIKDKKASAIITDALTPEQAAGFAYQSSGIGMNQRYYLGEPLTELQQQHNAAMLAAAKEHKLESDTILYRGVQPDTFIDPATSVGKVVTEPGWLSLSTKQDMARRFGPIQIELTVPRGTESFPLSDVIGDTKGEGEVLLTPKTSFRIISAEKVGRGWNLKAEVVSPETKVPEGEYIPPSKNVPVVKEDDLVAELPKDYRNVAPDQLKEGMVLHGLASGQRVRLVQAPVNANSKDPKEYKWTVQVETPGARRDLQKGDLLYMSPENVSSLYVAAKTAKKVSLKKAPEQKLKSVTPLDVLPDPVKGTEPTFSPNLKEHIEARGEAVTPEFKAGARFTSKLGTGTVYEYVGPGSKEGFVKVKVVKPGQNKGLKKDQIQEAKVTTLSEDFIYTPKGSKPGVIFGKGDPKDQDVAGWGKPSELLPKEAEKAFTEHHIKPETNWEKFRQGLTDFGHDLTRTFRDIPHTAENQPIISLLQQKEMAPEIANIRGVNTLVQEIGSLTPAEQAVYERAMYVLDMEYTINELARKWDEQHGNLNDFDPDTLIPDGWSYDDLISAVTSVRKNLQPGDRVTSAIEARAAAAFPIRNEFAQAYKAVMGREPAFDNPYYFRHKVIAYADKNTGGGWRIEARPDRGYMKERKGTNLPHETSFVDAEMDALTTMIKDTIDLKILKELRDNHDIAPEMHLANIQLNHKDVVSALESAAIGNLTALKPDIWEQIGELAEKGILPDRIDGKYRDLMQAIQTFHNTNRERKAAGAQALPVDPAMEKEFAAYAKWATSRRRQSGQLKSGRVPKGYAVYPITNQSVLYRGHTIAEAAYKQAQVAMTADILEIPESAVREGLLLAKKPPVMILPEGLVKTLNGWEKRQNTKPDTIAGAVDQKIHSGFKFLALFSPERAMPYFRGNLFSDTNSLWNANMLYRAGRRIPIEAAKIARNLVFDKPIDKDLQWLVDRGLFSAGYTASEGLGGAYALKRLKQFYATKPGIGKTAWNTIKWGLQVPHDIREGSFRAAVWKELVKQMRSNPEGRPANFGPADQARAMSLPTIEERAWYIMQETLGNYQATTENTRRLRKRIFPFLSWPEILVKQTYGTVRNVWDVPEYTYDIGTRVSKGKLTGYRAYAFGRLVAKIAAPVGMAQAWNWGMYPEAEKQLSEEDRGRPHLIVGYDPKTKKADVIKGWHNVSEVGAFFGFDKSGYYYDKLMSGRMTVGEVVREMTVDNPLNWAYKSMGPYPKLFAETLSGISRFPDFNKPHSVKDPVENIFKSWALDGAYRWLMDIPGSKGIAGEGYRYAMGKQETPGYWQKVFTGVAQTDLGDAVYNDVRSNAGLWAEKQGKKRALAVMMNFDPRAQYLYHARRAMSVDDREAALTYLAEAGMRTGLTDDDIVRSFMGMQPLHGLDEHEIKEYLKTLTPAEQLKVRQAYLHWSTRYAPGAPLEKLAGETSTLTFVLKAAGLTEAELMRQHPIQSKMQKDPKYKEEVLQYQRDKIKKGN